MVLEVKLAKSSTGFDMDGRLDCFYSRGIYFAHKSRYSHHYAFSFHGPGGHTPRCGRTLYPSPRHVCAARRHKKQPKEWPKYERQKPGAGRLALGDDYDSVEGGPHRPLLAGPGEDDSLICVVYKSSQAMAEFVVTYKVLSELACLLSRC